MNNYADIDYEGLKPVEELWEEGLTRVASYRVNPCTVINVCKKTATKTWDGGPTLVRTSYWVIRYFTIGVIPTWVASVDADSVTADEAFAIVEKVIP